jgi:uncharacterized protein
VRRLYLGGIALFVTCLCSIPCGAQVLDGTWIGEIDFGKASQPVNLSFKTASGVIKGVLDLPEENQMGLLLDRIVFEPPRVHIEWKDKSSFAVLDGVLQGDSISGQIRQGEKRATFGLARYVKASPQVYERIAGSYRLAKDRFIDIGANNADELRYVDTKTGRLGTLYPSSESVFFSGPTVDTAIPINIRVTFVKNGSGEVTGLKWSEGDASPIFAKKLGHLKEAVTFRNGAATLAGNLFLPPTKGPHAAIVIINPGYSFPRSSGYFPYFFLHQGIAVLTLNGKSVEGQPADYQRASFEERARDALAGVELLKGRRGIDPKRIGLHGASLSSWVAPLAATLSSDVAFLILRVGSAIPVAENILYEIENDLRERGFPEDDIAKAIALRRLLNQTILTNTNWERLKAEVEGAKNESWFGYARVGWFSSIAIPPDARALKGLQDPIRYDPVPVLQRVTIPVLAFNGELDRSVNTNETVPIMERALRRAGNKDFTIIVLPKASHDLLEAKTGYSSEYRRLRGFVSGYWDTMAVWLRKQMDAPRN